jgi:hypothetical protein
MSCASVRDHRCPSSTTLTTGLTAPQVSHLGCGTGLAERRVCSSRCHASFSERHRTEKKPEKRALGLHSEPIENVLRLPIVWIDRQRALITPDRGGGIAGRELRVGGHAERER